MPRPDFETMAREWLVKAQGHARLEHERSLAAEFDRVYGLAVAQAIEAVHAVEGDDATIDEVQAGLRALSEKPFDQRGN